MRLQFRQSDTFSWSYVTSSCGHYKLWCVLPDLSIHLWWLCFLSSLWQRSNIMLHALLVVFQWPREFNALQLKKIHANRQNTSKSRKHPQRNQIEKADEALSKKVHSSFTDDLQYYNCYQLFPTVRVSEKCLMEGGHSWLPWELVQILLMLYWC